MQGDVVGFKLAVGVEQQASQVAPQPGLPALEGPQEEAPGVVVVGVQVVPDERRALEDRLHLGQAVHGQLPGDDLAACGPRAEGTGSEKVARRGEDDVLARRQGVDEPLAFGLGLLDQSTQLT
ncbi:hypothetical protein EYF80_039311 [Liparis tanakae]|uniref:Uncharacterized protein n=1 Tax=Liparis tanakae TaxID=230148 RepID=A0A4Z2GBB4_9TELE|nr:hypothetical protein EYF80_039311 [Liparis tanakae]